MSSFVFVLEIHIREIYDVCTCHLFRMSLRNMAKHKDKMPTVMEL
jgi:hypothetical protein